LNKLRSRVEGLLGKAALGASSLGLTPNTLTLISLLVAALGLLLASAFNSGTLLALSIVTSGFIDALDGALARLTGMASKRGAFLDSFVDRVCELIFAVGFARLGFNTYAVLLFLAFSNLTSYARARGESLGVQLAGVGLMERAERVIALTVAAALVDVNEMAAHYVYLVITALVGITAVQRFTHTWKFLRSQASAERS